jgi:LmbE family N-acetylglucosaminyl deacetylase
MEPVSPRDPADRHDLLDAPLEPFPTRGAAPGDESNEPRRRKTVVTGGHPGDPEYGCGGTIARFTEIGHEVVLLYLNNGERPGTPPKARGVRTAEARRACEILRARPLFAGQVDGEAVVDAAHYEAFRKILEAERPGAVFTHWPIDNHADHRAIALLVYDAWLSLGRAFALFYYEVTDGEDTLQFAPTHYVDISGVAARKRESCYAHASQAPNKFYSLQEAVTTMRGLESGHRQAEGFIRHVQGPDFPLPGTS